MAPRETGHNAYAKFWGDKQRALWYVMVFSGVVNSSKQYYPKGKMKIKTNLHFRLANRWLNSCSHFNKDRKKPITNTAQILGNFINGVNLQHKGARRRENWISVFYSRVVFWVIDVGVEFSLHVYVTTDPAN